LAAAKDGQLLVTDDGIYFVDSDATVTQNIDFHNFANKHMTRLSPSRHRHFPGPKRLSRWQMDPLHREETVDNDIMLVENFQ